jgi:hypothetical protein
MTNETAGVHCGARRSGGVAAGGAGDGTIPKTLFVVLITIRAVEAIVMPNSRYNIELTAISLLGVVLIILLIWWLR